MAGLFTIGTTGLQAAYAGLQTTSHNIANLNTPGFSRQQTIQSTGPASTGGGSFFGSGVRLETIPRSYDQFLTAEVQRASASQSAAETRNALMTRMDSVFPTGGDSIGEGIDDFFAVARDLSVRPGDTAVRMAFLARANDLSSKLSNTDQQLESLGRAVEQQLSDSAKSINETVARIADLNERIRATRGMTGQPNDLLDARDKLIADLNAQIRVSVVPQEDGTFNLFVAGGQTLLVGSNRAQIEMARDTADPQKTVAQLVTPGGARLTLDGPTLGGKLGGTLQFRDQDLGTARSRLGQIATVVTQTVNAQQALGLDARGQPGAPVFSVPAPVVNPRSTNSGSLAMNVAISDVTALSGTDYEATFDGAQWTLRRLNDGQVNTFSALPINFEGITLSAGGGTPQAGDRFAVRAVTGAASNMKTVLNDPLRVATAAAVAVNSGTGNLGATAGGLTVLGANANLNAPVTITFTAAGTFDVTGAGTGNPTGLSYSPGASISFNGWSLSLNGQPRAGDTFTIGPNTQPAADNRNALSLSALQTAALANGQTLTASFASLSAEVGIRANGARSEAEASKQVLDDATRAQQSVAGVNLDEELSKMMSYQQAYQASAKIIQAAQSVFDELLSMGR